MSAWHDSDWVAATGAKYLREKIVVGVDVGGHLHSC
jgi:hypothetical protein